MAVVKAVQKSVARPVQVASKTRNISVVDLISGSEILVEDGIDFVQRGPGGRGASPENEALRDKANTLKIGQGFKVPKTMQIARTVKNSQTGAESTIYTYKGANLIAKISGKKFRTRRDTNGNMYVFRVTPNVAVAVAVTEEEEEG